MAEIRSKLDPDETVKAVYRATKRELRGRVRRGRRSELERQLEFLERIYRF